MKTATKKRPVRLRAKAQPISAVETLDELVLTTLRIAVVTYHQAIKDTKSLDRDFETWLAANDDVSREVRAPADRMGYFVWTMKRRAEKTLVLGILAAMNRVSREDDDVSALGFDWKPVALELDGSLFIVSQAPEDEGDFPDPRLTVIDPTDFKADWKDS